MNILTSDQSPKVGRVLCHDDPILGNTACEHEIVRFVQPADVPWVGGVMNAGRVEVLRKLRRETFIDE